MALKHAKTNSVPAWTQSDLDAAIAAGTVPAGTTLAGFVLSADWNSDHVVDSAGIKFADNSVQTTAATPLSAGPYSVVGNNTASAAAAASNQSIMLGTPGFAGSGIAVQATGNVAGTYQLEVQNKSTNAGASTDLVATADNGTDIAQYVDLGVNSSTFSDPTWTVNGAGDAYLYASDGELAIGTASNKTVDIFTGGTLAANRRVQIGSAGLVTLNGSTVTTPIIYGSSAPSGSLTLASTSDAAKGLIYFGSAQTAFFDAANQYFQINTNGAGTTQTLTSGTWYQNSTAAATGLQQISPSVVWEGQGWKTTATAASQPVRFQAYTLPVQGTTAPTGTWVLQSSINSAAFSNVLTITSVGVGFFASSLGVNGYLGTNGGSTNANFFIPGSASAVTGTFALAGSTSSFYRSLFGGLSATAITAAQSYTNMFVNAAPIASAATGTHPIFSNMYVKPIGAITANGATITNTASLYVEGAATATVAGGNYALYSAAGTNYLAGATGIGAALPQQTLHVTNTTAYQGILINGNGAPNVCFAPSATTTPTWKVGLSGNNSNNFTISSGASNADKLVIDPAGLVTIGGLSNTQIVAQATGVSGTAVAGTLAYTNASGKTLIVTGATVRCTAATAITNGPTVAIGTTNGGTDIFAAQAINALTTTSKMFWFTRAGMSVIVPNGGTVYVNVTAAATGTSQTIACDIEGYYV